MGLKHVQLSNKRYDYCDRITYLYRMYMEEGFRFINCMYRSNQPQTYTMNDIEEAINQ